MPRTTAPLGAPVVLVVDDDWSIVMLLEAQLERRYVVVKCLDPLDALARCEASPVAALVADWHMPGFSGLELLEVLQQKHPTVRRVLVTAAPREPEVREGLASGLVELLIEKPWGRDELVDGLAQLLASPPAL